MNFLLRRLTQPSALSLKPRFFFSISKQQMIEMHEAILASRIIETIQTEPQGRVGNEQIDGSKNQNNDFPSLRTQLISMIKQYSPTNEESGTKNNENDDGQSIQTAKNNMLKFFDGGVWVDQDLCIQQRFISEIRKPQQKNLNEQQDNSGQKSPQSKQKAMKRKKKITFCPTYLITGQIFRIITYNIRYLLITGHFGIDKTYSFMLYHLLSDRIYRYLHKYKKRGNQLSDGIPKLVYLNIDIERFIKKGQSLINDIIAKQCYELTSEHPNYDFLHIDHDHDQVILDEFYDQKNIDLRLIINQIDVIASASRNRDKLIQFKQFLQDNHQYQNAKLKAYYDESKKKLLDQLNKKNKQIIEEKFKFPEKILKRFDYANQLFDMVEELRVQFGRALYLSSRTIQESQMIYLNLNGQHSHFEIQQKYLEFMEFSQTQKNVSDIAEFFVFMLQLRYKELLKTENISQKQKNILLKIKKIVLNCLQKKNVMLLPYTIYLVFFEKKTNSQNIKFLKIIKDILKQNNSNQQLEKYIDQIIDKINNKSKAQLIKLIESFLKKSQTKKSSQVAKKKKILLLKLLYAIKQKMSEKNFDPEVKKREITVDASEIFNNMNVYSQQVSQNLSKNIAYYMDDKKFYLTVNEQIALEILESYEISLLQALQESDAKIYSLIPTKVSKGLFIEYLIRKCLSIQGSKLILKIQKEKVNDDDKEFQNMKEEQNLYFQSIPLKNSKNYHNCKFLTDIFFKLKNLNVGGYLFMPTRQKLDETKQLSTGINQQKKIDKTSKKIDFIVAQNQGQNIKVTAFNVTIQTNKALTKISDFFYELSNFQNKQQEKTPFRNSQKSVALRYVVLVPQLFPNNIQWETLIYKAISLLKKEKQDLMEKENDSKDKSKNKKSSFQKIERLQKRIEFLENLSKKQNLIQKKSSLEINRNKVKTLLREVSIFSIFDLQINTKECIHSKDISFFTRLLEKAQLEHRGKRK